MPKVEYPVATIVHWEERAAGSDIWTSHEAEFALEQTEDGFECYATTFVAEELWPKQPFATRNIFYTNRYRGADDAQREDGEHQLHLVPDSGDS